MTPILVASSDGDPTDKSNWTVISRDPGVYVSIVLRGEASGLLYWHTVAFQGFPDLSKYRRLLAVVSSNVSLYDIPAYSDVGVAKFTMYGGVAVGIDVLTGITPVSSYPGVTLFVAVFDATSAGPLRYNAAPDIEDRRTELTPYAYGIRQSLDSGAGSAYGSDGLVGAENLAHARAIGLLHRQAERLGGESCPPTSVVMMETWARGYGLTVAGKSRYRLRRQLDGLWYAHGRPVSRETVVGTLARVCPERPATLATSPDIWTEADDTYWHDGTDDTDLSLGDGHAWTSGRAKLDITLQTRVVGCTTEAEDQQDADEVLAVVLGPHADWEWS